MVKTSRRNSINSVEEELVDLDETQLEKVCRQNNAILRFDPSGIERDEDIYREYETSIDALMERREAAIAAVVEKMNLDFAEEARILQEQTDGRFASAHKEKVTWAAFEKLKELRAGKGLLTLPDDFNPSVRPRASYNQSRVPESEALAPAGSPISDVHRDEFISGRHSYKFAIPPDNKAYLKRKASQSTPADADQPSAKRHEAEIKPYQFSNDLFATTPLITGVGPNPYIIITTKHMVKSIAETIHEIKRKVLYRNCEARSVQQLGKGFIVVFGNSDKKKAEARAFFDFYNGNTETTLFGEPMTLELHNCN